jgi:hypothetical protein
MGEGETRRGTQEMGGRCSASQKASHDVRRSSFFVHFYFLSSAPLTHFTLNPTGAEPNSYVAGHARTITGMTITATPTATVTTATVTETTATTAHGDDRQPTCNGMTLKATPTTTVRTTTAMTATPTATDSDDSHRDDSDYTNDDDSGGAPVYDRVWDAAANFRAHQRDVEPSAKASGQ